MMMVSRQNIFCHPSAGSRLSGAKATASLGLIHWCAVKISILVAPSKEGAKWWPGALFGGGLAPAFAGATGFFGGGVSMSHCSGEPEFHLESRRPEYHQILNWTPVDLIQGPCWGRFSVTEGRASRRNIGGSHRHGNGPWIKSGDATLWQGQALLAAPCVFKSRRLKVAQSRGGRPSAVEHPDFPSTPLSPRWDDNIYWGASRCC